MSINGAALKEVLAFPMSAGPYFLPTDVNGYALHTASRRLGGGIISEGVHFYATPGGYYFFTRECLEIARAALASINDTAAPLPA